MTVGAELITGHEYSYAMTGSWDLDLLIAQFGQSAIKYLSGGTDVFVAFDPPSWRASAILAGTMTKHNLGRVLAHGGKLLVA